MWNILADSTGKAMRQEQGLPPDHPVGSTRPYNVFLYSPADVQSRIKYIESNPIKERLPVQRHPFVLPYNGWPFHKR